MKQFIFFVLVLICSGLCPAQSHYSFKSGFKTITTTTDTIHAIKSPNEVYHLIVINDKASTDTLQWWTDSDTNKTNLAPNMESYRDKIFLNYLFRKAKNTSVTSKAEGY